VNARPDSPYKGLTAFDDSELDALLFFGREREREIVVANLIASRLTVLYGPSGVGKSSLLRASVSRSLRDLPEEPLVVVFSSWSDDPAAALARAVEETAAGGSTGASLEVAIEEAQAERDVYLILDQLEEYFLYQDGDDREESFARTLPVLMAGRSRVNVLFSLREDALARLDRFAGRIPGLFGNTLRLDRLDREAARAAVVRPVERYAELTGESVSLEPELVEAVLDQVSAGKIEAPLAGVGAVEGAESSARIEAPYLQLVLQRIWDEERAAGSTTLRAATLERLGGAQHIVEEHLERALSSLTREQRDVAARIFGHLVTPSGTKIAHEESDLVAFAQVGVDELRPVLDALRRERILRSDEDDAAVRYEIFHDVLAQPMLAWRTRHGTEREIERQVEEQARRRSRMQRLLALGTVLALILAGAVLFALIQERNADEKSRDARARTLDASAIALLTEDPELSLLLARESARLAPGPTAEDALLQSLLSSRVRARFDTGGPASAVAFVPKRRAVAFVDAEGVFHLVSAATGVELASLDVGPGSSVAVSADGSYAVVRSEAGPPRVAELPSGRTRCTLEGVGGRAAAAAPVGERVVTVRNGIGSIWDSRTCSLERRVGRVGPTAVRVVTSGDGMRVAFVSGREARILDLTRPRARVRLVHPGDLTSLAFGPGGRVVTGGRDRLARIWNGRTGRRIAELEGHAGQVLDVAFSPLGTEVATASTDGTTRIWDAGTGELLAPLFGHTDFVRTVEFAPDGLSVVTSSDDGTARTWALNGRRLATFAGHSARLGDAVFSPDGTLVATVGEDGSVRVWETGVAPDLLEREVEPPPAPVTEAASPNGAVRATADGSIVTLTRDDGTTDELDGHRLAVTSVAFSPDGRRLVSAGRDSDVILWDVRTAAVLRRLRGHFGEVSDGRYSPDGRWIVTAGPRSVGLWRASDGRLIRLLVGPEGPFTQAAFLEDSSTIVARTEDGTIVAYDCRICGGAAELVALADERLAGTGRELTPEERTLYFG
jgi:WD40 repeat protein